MAQLSSEQWLAAQQEWEVSPKAGYEWLAKSLQARGWEVTRQAISKAANRDGWAKRDPLSAPVAPKKTPQKIAKQATKQAKKTVAEAVAHPVAQPTAQPKKVVAQPAKKVAQPSQNTPDDAPTRVVGELMEPRSSGRPSVYREQYAQQLIDFFTMEVESLVEEEVIDEHGKVHIDKKLVLNRFPTLTRFAAEIGVSAKTLWEWANEKEADGTPRRPEFCNAYARARDLQTSLLIEGGISGRYEPRFAVFTAKNLIGWRDQPEAQEAPTTQKIDVDALNQIYERGMAQMEADRAAVMARLARLAN